MPKSKYEQVMAAISSVSPQHDSHVWAFMRYLIKKEQ
jgi:hypothetical protein